MNDRQYEQAARWFATTHWSVVLSATGTDPQRAQMALEDLCCTYWYPLYAYVRRRGYGIEDAEDLTQAYFERVIAKQYLSQVHPQKGKFRSFLLASLNHFLADDWKRASAAKRGGGKTMLSLDDATAEDRYRLEPVEAMDAEKLYERRWALTLLEQVLNRLKAEMEAAGRTKHFEVLQPFLVGENGPVTCADAGAALGTTEGAVRIAVHRMRERYRQLFREEIANTVGTEAQMEDEMQHVYSVLATRR